MWSLQCLNYFQLDGFTEKLRRAEDETMSASQAQKVAEEAKEQLEKRHADEMKKQQESVNDLQKQNKVRRSEVIWCVAVLWLQ